jgi:hypothetical protein
MGTKQ